HFGTADRHQIDIVLQGRWNVERQSLRLLDQLHFRLSGARDQPAAATRVTTAAGARPRSQALTARTVASGGSVEDAANAGPGKPLTEPLEHRDQVTAVERRTRTPNVSGVAAVPG